MALHSIPVETSTYVVSGGAFVSSISGVTIIDDFNDNLNNWTGGDGASITASPTFEGGGALQFDAGSTNLESSGLPELPAQGDEINIYFRYDNEPTGRIYVRIATDPNSAGDWYGLLIENDDVELRTDGGSTFLVGLSPATTTNTWYRINVKWDDGSTFGGVAGDFTVEVFDTSDGSSLASGSGNDTDNTGDSGMNIVDVDMETGESFYLDYFHEP